MLSRPAFAWMRPTTWPLPWWLLLLIIGMMGYAVFLVVQVWQLPTTPLRSAAEWQQIFADADAKRAARQQREAEHDALLRAIHEDLQQIRTTLEQHQR